MDRKAIIPWLSGSAIESPAACHLVILTVNGEWIRIVRISWQTDGRAENPSVISKWGILNPHVALLWSLNTARDRAQASPEH